MNTVDEILASGWYTDRQGRAWKYDPDFGVWLENPSHEGGVTLLSWVVDAKHVRLLIERDQHRETCVGIDSCEDHPVYFVRVYNGFPKTRFVVYGPHFFDDEQAYFYTLPEAMDAARALAVGE